MTEDSGFQVGRDAPAYYQSQVRPIMEPFAAALVAGSVRKGDAVLDVACGTGFATRAAALAAGPGARVEGADLNPAMVAQAGAMADNSGAKLGWTEASALELPFVDDEFDAVICQQGLQFFPDPAAGIAEMTRVTRAGGRLGATVWCPQKKSPFFYREFEMLTRHGGAAQGDWSTTEARLRSWFTDAGVGQVNIEVVEAIVDLPPVPVYVPEHLKALPWSGPFFDLPVRQQASALAELDAELAEFHTAEGLRVPFTSYLATVQTQTARRVVR